MESAVIDALLNNKRAEQKQQRRCPDVSQHHDIAGRRRVLIQK
jgi:hypothetical protein